MSLMLQAILALVAVLALTAVVWRVIPKGKLRAGLVGLSVVLVVLLGAILIKAGH